MQELKPIFKSVLELKDGFVKLREEVIEDINKAEKERALAGTDDEAKAHEPDHQRPATKSNIA